jgi:YesN/AraC family two-component response regulator
MEIASGLIKLKPGTEAKVEEWRSTIASRLDEAAATHQDEQVQIESWFTMEVGGEKYLLWYMRAKSIRRVFEVSQQLKHPIDKFHFELMEAITAANIFAKPLIDLTREQRT